MKAERDLNMTAADDSENELLDYYQLSHDPFLPRTPGFKFFTPQRKTVLAQLHHLARFSTQLAVVLGPLGSGKSLLRQALVASTNKDSVQCIVTSAREVGSPAALTSFVAQAIGAARTDEGIVERAEQLHQTGMQVYIVIDDAQLLAPQSVKNLAELSLAGGKSSPKIFLFAEESIRPALDAIIVPDHAEWLHLIELQPYTLEETRDYLAQRLEAAGQGIELLSDAQVFHIHQRSGGWPGLINEEGKETMLADMDEQAPVSTRSGSSFPLRSVVAVVLVAIGVGAAWMMGDRPDEPARTVLQLPDPVVEIDVTERLDASSDAPSAAPDGLNIVEAGSEVPEDIELPQDNPLPVEQIPAPVATTVPAAEEAPPAPEPVVVPAQASASATQEPAPVRPSPPAIDTQQGFHATDWYRQRPADEYALQLLGTRSRQAALDFISRQSGIAELGYFETRHEGKPWFVVTQGAYSSREQAQAGVTRLPDALRNQNPWPRTMASIQQSLP
ncbi:MAG TPA: cell division protein [Pseudomonas xinjiangensis]|uniref:Cell division protein n=2 Tax=root TaxID=1 RepID=A0A7V1BQA7_9GAMM|nr:cell division protein [Halopseudomonas xinjiangensis]HEC47320.1 cell division protein [Halopseudomonas xinjiangensis]